MRGRLCCLTLLLAALPSIGWAQSFSFGFASGGGHGGHHHGGHGCYGGYSDWYGFDFYRPPIYRYPPVVYAPPPVTYVYPAPTVQLVQPVPAVSQVAPSPGLSAADTAPSLASQPSSNSAVRLNSLPMQQRANVVLRNPEGNGGRVAFRVQDQVDAELGPGTTRTWSDRTSLTVEFDRGGEFGTDRKILRPGAYEFVVTEQGWDLVAAVMPTANGRAASLQKNTLPSPTRR